MPDLPAWLQAMFEAPGDLSGRRHSPIMALLTRMPDGRP